MNVKIYWTIPNSSLVTLCFIIHLIIYKIQLSTLNNFYFFTFLEFSINWDYVIE